MRVTIAAIGRMKAGPEKQLADRYVDRFAKSGPALGLDFAKLVEFPESRLSNPGERRREEACKLSAVSPAGAAACMLDETGKTLTSQEFAEALAAFRDGARRDLVVLLGGPDGHDEALRAGADLVFSLGRVTFPHQIARILVAEQLYRAATILAGHPYHRA